MIFFEFLENVDKGIEKVQVTLDKVRDALDEVTSPSVIDVEWLKRRFDWSQTTFGPGKRTHGVLNHIRKELVEIEEDPDDLEEWIDLINLALDGAGRAGHSPEAIINMLKSKQIKNENRTWPDWRTFGEDQAIEHVR